MSNQGSCTGCGVPLTGGSVFKGLCPRCLLGLGLESSNLPTEVTQVRGSSLEARPSLAWLSPGQILGNRYEIHSLLGRGGMGEVWHAFDVKLRVDVALKALRAEYFKSEKRRELLREEVRSAREVLSPNVCRVFDLVELDGNELVSMEYIDGTTLLQLLENRGPLSLREAGEIAAQFLSGLDAVHRAGLVHRDFKPENVMITRTGRVVVMDFGVAKRSESGAGTVAGTPAYMAPEQGRGEAVDARADIFSAGLVLAEMIAEEGVRDQSTRESLWEGVRQEPPVLPTSPWHPVLARAVSKEPSGRYPSAGALMRALEEVTLRDESSEEKRPYPGLSSFTEEDAEHFYGREAEVEAMWRKLERPHLLALIGPSGAGKSSFLRAGLVPAMPEGWRHIICQPGDKPFLAMARSLTPELSGDTDAVNELLAFEDLDVAVSVVSRWRKQHVEALLIVDQFEELFTLNTPEVQSRFAELLGRLAIEADVHVLLSMRDDFLLYCNNQPPLAPIFSELTPLSPPAGDALRRALVQPALGCGYRFEDESLVDEMLVEVSQERGALPLLAFAASRLWELRDRENGFLTRTAYEKVGGVGGSLAYHAEATLERIGPSREGIVREIFRNLVTAQGTRAVRDREELLSVFESREEAAEVLKKLIDARLLTSFEIVGEKEDERHHRIEIIHESLLSAWPRLVRWQTQDADSSQLRDQLRQAAQLWKERHRSEDLLWTGTAFQEFQLWRERYPGGLTKLEEAFTQAMVVKAERRRRRRRLAVAAALLMAFGISAVTGTLWQRSVAQARRAEASKLLALGQIELEDNPTAALAYAMASLELADEPEARQFALEALWRGPTEFRLSQGTSFSASFSPDGQWLATGARDQVSLLSATSSAPKSLPAERQALFADPDRLVWCAGGGGSTVSIWSVSQNQLLRRFDFSAFGDRIECRVAGDRLVALSYDRGEQGLVHVNRVHIDGGDPVFLGTIEVRPASDERATQSTTGQVWESQLTMLLAMVDPSGDHIAYPEGRSLYLRALDDLQQRTLVGWHDAPSLSAMFDPEGKRLASVDTTGEIRIWSTARGASDPLRVLRTEHDSLRAVRFDPKGIKLVTEWNESGRAAVWDLTGPPDAEPLYLKRQAGSRLLSSSFHPNGQWVVFATYGGGVAYPLGRPYPHIFRGHKGILRGLAFSPDGKWLASASSEGELRLRPLSPEVAKESKLQMANANFWGLAFDPKSRFVVLGCGTTDPARYPPLVVPMDGSAAWHFTGVEDDCERIRVAVGPRGRWIAAGGDIENCLNVRLWDLETGETRVLDVTERAGSISRLQFTSDGNLLVFVRDLEMGGRSLFSLNLENDAPELMSDFESIWWYEISGDGSTIAYISEEERENVTIRRLFVYDVETGVHRNLPAHEGISGQEGLRGIAIDRTGKLVATGDESGTVRVGPVTEEEPHLLLGHEGPVTELAFSSDGKWIASLGFDQTVRLWPVPEGDSPLHTLPYEELMEKLRSLTNMRVVPDEEYKTGYRIDYEPFPGFAKVPVW